MRKIDKRIVVLAGLVLVLVVGFAVLSQGVQAFSALSSSKGAGQSAQLICVLPARLSSLISVDCSPPPESQGAVVHAHPPAAGGGDGAPSDAAVVSVPTDQASPEPVDQVYEPRPDAPLCPVHDPVSYHDLWNEALDCHYDHTHGNDPADTPFAEQAADWDFDFAWQTFSTYGGDPWAVPNADSVFENEAKHEGYYYLYDEAAGGCENVISEEYPEANCVRRVLYQLHSIGTHAEMTTRFHSFRMIAEVCTADGSRCGTIETGGIHDYGTLHCTYKKGHCELPFDPPGPLPVEISMNQPPYRAFQSLADSVDFPPERDLRDGIVSQYWNSQSNPVSYPYYPHEPNFIVGTAWSFIDAAQLLYKSDPTHSYSVCGEGLGISDDECEFNHSSPALFAISLSVPAELILQAEGGAINYDGFTDRYGHLVEGCKTPGLDCVPLRLVDYPAGELALLTRQVSDENFGARIGEFDIYFDANGKVCPVSSPMAEGCETSGWIVPP